MLNCVQLRIRGRDREGSQLQLFGVLIMRRYLKAQTIFPITQYYKIQSALFGLLGVVGHGHSVPPSVHEGKLHNRSGGLQGREA